MVGVAQLVEPRVVIPAVAGSSPVAHPRPLPGLPMTRPVRVGEPHWGLLQEPGLQRV